MRNQVNSEGRSFRLHYILGFLAHAYAQLNAQIEQLAAAATWAMHFFIDQLVDCEIPSKHNFYLYRIFGFPSFY